MGFKEALAGHNVIFVAGAGVSIGATHSDTNASWRGLVEGGIETYARLSSDPGAPNWRNLCLGMLEQNDTSMLLAAASQVQIKLRSIGDQAYANWLRDALGQLRAVETSTIDALRSSASPILTTNYDTLLEGAAGSSCSWLDPVEMQQVIAGESSSIGHIHGVWTQPESVVLSESDYARHGQAPAIQDLQRAALGIKTLVYVGYGSGFDDPNFANWIRWHRDTYPGSRREHYRLCLESELDTLNRVHANDSITPISFGRQHADLSRFIRLSLAPRGEVALTPAGKVRDAISEVKSDFEETMRTHSVVTFTSQDGDEPNTPIIPPPLLPVPYARYVRQRSSDRNSIPTDRLDPVDVSNETGTTVVACEEGGGLTTALRWLALSAADQRPGVAPVYLSFGQCVGKSDPVMRAVRRSLGASGFVMDRTSGSGMPDVALAIDEVHSYGRVSEFALREIASLGFSHIFLGCRVGDEEEVLATLRSAGAQPTVRYVGRLERQDVQSLVELVAPRQVASLMSQITEAFSRTHLPRTPMTVFTIVYILLHSDTPISSTASQSGILEQYVAVLLGRGNPLEDARISIEARGRESVLAGLAERFVVENTHVLAESTVVEHFSDHFKKVGWRESETKLLESFIRRGVLRRTSGGIEYQHSSFVFLFAAKRAMTHDGFLEMLLRRPLYYSRILQVYAGLAREDSRPLASLLEAHSSRLSEMGLEPGKAYLPVAQAPLPDDFDDDLGDDAEPDGEASGDGEVESGYSPLDYPEPAVPLFSSDVDLPAFAEMARILELFSSVIRDADQVEDLKLKRASLGVLLEGWGRFISTFSQSASFRDLVVTLAEEIGSQRVWNSRKTERLIDLLERILPAAAAMGGVNFTLKSRTLLIPLEDEMRDRVDPPAELLVGAALLLVSIGERGWPRELAKIYARSPRLSIWLDYFVYDLEQAYSSDRLTEVDRAAALELIVEIRLSPYRSESKGALDRYGDRLRDGLRARRLRIVSRAALTSEAAESAD